MSIDLNKYSPDQPRDKNGQWAGGAGGSVEGPTGGPSASEMRRESKMHPTELGMRRSEDPAAYDKQLANWKAHNPGKPEPKGPGVGHQLLNSFLAFFNPSTDRVS